MITTQQAIDYLRDPICEGLSTKEKLKLHEEAVVMAVEALEKQIPKEPVYKKDDIYVKNQFVELPHCPACNWEVPTGDMHCFMCGQAIDWGENNDTE